MHIHMYTVIYTHKQVEYKLEHRNRIISRLSLIKQIMQINLF